MSDPRDASGYSATDLISVGFIASPMFIFAIALGLQRKFVEFYAAGKFVASLCHGTAILR